NTPQNQARRGTLELEGTAIEFEKDVHSVVLRNNCGRGMRLLSPLLYFGTIVKNTAEATSGELVKTSVDDVGTAFRETLERLRKRYTLGYHAAPDAQHQPGSYHKLEVRLAKQHGKAREDYFIAARRGYFTPKE